MAKQLAPGDTFPTKSLKNIHGAEVAIPDPGARWVHVQFRRFAGCPICNLHLQSVIKRHDEIRAAGIREVVLFHSSDQELLPYQGKFPFDVIGDPDKRLYQELGVESSIWSLLNPLAWPAIIKGNFAKDKPKSSTAGGVLGLPADFLLSRDGTIVDRRYGKHMSDQWSVDELLARVAVPAVEADARTATE